MKKIKLTRLLFLIFIISLTTILGCGKNTSTSIDNKNINHEPNIQSNKNIDKNINHTNASKEKQENKSKNLESNKKCSTSTTTLNNESTDELFYGKWVIDSLISFSHIGCYSEKDVQAILGNELSYTKNHCKFKDNKISTPYYQKKIINNDEFISMYKDSFCKLGIKDSKVVLITIYPDKKSLNTETTWDSIGSNFIILDKNTLLVIVPGGGYFKAIRIK